MDNHGMNAINVRDQMYKELQKDVNNTDPKNNFEKCRNRLNELIKKAKIDYYRSMVEENKNCPKKLWDTIKLIRTNALDKDKPLHITDSGGVVHTDPKEVSNIFNTFFAQIGSKLASKIKPVNGYNVKDDDRTAFSLFLAQTNEYEIIKVIMSLKLKKMPGIDSIKAEVLRDTAILIARPIAYLVNCIFQSGVCPDNFKTAVIKPLFKSGDGENVANYRPISLMTNLKRKRKNK